MDGDFLLYNLKPTGAQARAATWAALVMLAGFLAVLPFRQIPLARFDALVPSVDSAAFISDIFVTILLLAKASVLRSRALIALGTGFFFVGLITIPQALTFPGAFSPGGLLGANPSTSKWLFYFWHCGLAVSIMAYTALKSAPESSPTSLPSPGKTIAVCLISATLLAGALTLLATVGNPILPQLMSDRIHGYNGKVIPAAYLVMLLIAVAMAVTWRSQKSMLDLCLLLVLWAWFLEIGLTALAGSRFTVGWYFAPVLGLLSDLFVLLVLFAETSWLYLQAIEQVRVRQWEQENGLMIREKRGASIAHELRQPLGAISLNAQTALRRASASDNFLSSILDDILSDSHRANTIVEGAGEILGQSGAQANTANINQLVLDTLGLVMREFCDRGVSVDLQLDYALHPIAANRLQMEQVFYNLFLNAAEALNQVAENARTLTIRSASDPTSLVVSVEAAGPGLTPADRKKILESFYMAKAREMGQGLSICRSIIATQGGWLAARAPAGTIFEIHLPYDGVSADRAA